MSIPNRIFFLLLLLVAIAGNIYSQSPKYTIVTVQPPQSFYLNGYSSYMGLGDPRTYIPVQLPEKTEEWYYSFTTVPVDASASLDLTGQLIRALEPSGISSAMFSAITVPRGNSKCSIFLVADLKNARNFNAENDFHFLESSSRWNITSGVVHIKEVTQTKYFLCLQNLKSLEGVNITIEIAALVDTSIPKTREDMIAESIMGIAGMIHESRMQKREQNKKHELFSNYGNTGWVFYEHGDFENALTYTNKALEITEHPGLYFNKGLIQWCRDNKEEYIQSYLKGLHLIYTLESQETAIQILEKGVKDIEEGLQKQLFFTETPPVLQLLNMKLREVRSLKKWKKKY